MIALADLSRCERAPYVYGGNAGRKESIWDSDGALWMVKYPEPTRGMRGNIASYTTSPISEWLGSHIYEILGIPVHDTVLGHRGGKLVVACRDFTYPDKSLLSFHDLKNSIPDEAQDSFIVRPSDGRSPYMSDVLAAMDMIAADYGLPEIRERFWDMFVVDALIGNADRNSENWGLLRHADFSVGLAPVFDNGNAFFNKRRDSTIEQRLADDAAMQQDAMGAARSCLLTDDGHNVAPLRFISSLASLDCNDAAVRVCEAWDQATIDDLIDSIPSEVLSFDIMPVHVKEFHKEILRRRFDEVVQPAALASRTSVRLSQFPVEPKATGQRHQR